MIVDTLDLAGGRAAASQSTIVAAELAVAPVSLLVAVAEAYKGFLDRLPLLAVIRWPGGGHCVVLAPLAPHFPLLSFAAPYLAAAHGGCELRYSIVGGLLTRGPGGHLAFGLAPEGADARLWVAVAGLRPLLGLGPLYILTQAQVHRILTVAFLRRLTAALSSGDGTVLLSRGG